MGLSDVRRTYGGTPVILNGSGAGTDTALVAAIADTRIVVDFFEVSADAVSTFQLNSKPAGAGTQIGAIEYMGANSGKVLDTPYIRTNKGEGLSVTTTGLANWSIYIIYHTIHTA